MKTMPISEFKAKALEVLNTVARTGRPVRVTKRGKPIAEVVPCSDGGLSARAGRLSDALAFEEDVVSPLGSGVWEASG